MTDQDRTLADSRLRARFIDGAVQEKTLIETVAKTVIRDKLVPPDLTQFDSGDEKVPTGRNGKLFISYPDPYKVDGEHLTIHRHALNQLASKVSLPMVYVNGLLTGEPWRQALLAHNFNELFKKPTWKDETRFLHRIVDGELRGFLSRRFNRHLASAPLLRAFIAACTKLGARPIEGISSPVRVSLKYLLPTAFEVLPDEYVGVGVEWSNSDFGAARLKVLQTVCRLSAAASVVVDEGFSRTHIGSVIEDSDLEMSDETAQKECAAQQSAITDTVEQSLNTRSVDRLLTALRAACDAKVSWTRLKAMLSFLPKSDLDAMKKTIEAKGVGVIDLPPLSFEPDGTPTANLYWASSYVGVLAARTEDEDRRLDLQHEAGKLLAEALATP